MTNLILSVLNKYLEQDVERAKQLDQVNGKVVHVVLEEINLDIYFKIEELFLHEVNSDNEADVTITISAKVFPDIIFGADIDGLIKNGLIEIRGDAHIASVLQNTLREIEIDWEEILSKYTGDTLAYQVGKGVRALQTFRRDLHENLRQDMRDYLQDNIQVSATKEEVEQYISEVDTVRAQVDRLEARINRLQKYD